MIFFLLLVIVLAGIAQAAEPVEASLDGEWDFTWTPASPEDVPKIPDGSRFDAQIEVPGKWDDQLERFRDAGWWDDAVFTPTLGPVEYLTGIGWHRTTVDPPSAWEGKAMRLTVGWAVGQVNVWMNGAHVGRYDHAVYTPCEFDVSRHLVPGEANELVISVDNTRGFTGGWAFLGNAGKASGISRPVTLRVAPSANEIADAYVRPGESLEEAVWQVELKQMEGAAPVGATVIAWDVRDGDNGAVLCEGKTDITGFEGRHQATWRFTADELLPWSPKEPNLYWTNLRWLSKDGELLDAHSQRFGLRRCANEGRKLFLNGERIYLRGDFGAYYFPVHCTTPTSKEFWERYIRRAKAIGMNYVNFAARVCPVELMEAADELGIILQCGDHMTVLKEHAADYEEVWRPIVRWTRRYPSMGLYGFGGERDYYEGIIEQYQRQYDLIKSMHPECLVMPQQAIRGIDYAFDEAAKPELTKKPFPHHAERLARYTKACDIFGHYSGGAFGYNYFAEPWRKMEERFLIYDKPLSMHELFMGMSYLNPDNATLYTGRVPPYLYTKLRADLEEADLLDRWATYNDASARLQAICQKYCVEKVRKCNELAGFEYLGMTDMHFCEHYTVGILDEFMQLKPGDTDEGILRYNDESVLLLDFGEHSINRSYWSGDAFEANVMVSLFGKEAIASGEARWALRNGDKVLLQGVLLIADVPTGGVTTLGKLGLTWPEVERTTRANLSFHLNASGYDLRNDWDFWVFPKSAPPKVAAAADEKALGVLGSRYDSVKPLSKESGERLRIVSALSEADVDHLAGGGDVLLLGVAPFLEYTSWRSFRPGLGAREHHNVGSVIAEHPLFADLPHEGWGDWQFFPVLEGATCVYFEEELDTAFDPILEIISSAEHVRKHAAIMEKRVGKGRLLVCTCVLDAPCAEGGANPSCVALTDGILRYVTSDAFQPKSVVAPETLTYLLNPAAAGEAANLVASPGFEGDDATVREDWLAYGAEYELDPGEAHSGGRSLKLTIAPEEHKNNPKHYTGARAKTVHFKRSPEALRLSAWHKAQAITESSGNSFLIFVYLTYRDGGRHTLRLHFEGGTHDWQYAETIWKPERALASAALYIGLGHRSGTAWLDDVFFGPAPVGETETETASDDVAWSREPVTVAFGFSGLYSVNGGVWQSGTGACVSREGVTNVAFKRGQDDTRPEVRVVAIDVTPPIITLKTKPALEQAGGVYSGTTDTEFVLQAEDGLSGIEAVEVSVDEGEYTTYREPFKLKQGAHTLRCRATDRAGNQSEVMTGSVLTGGETGRLQLNIQ